MKFGVYEFVTLILAIVGSVSSLLFLYQLLRNSLRSSYTWREVTKATAATIEWLNAKGFQPDVVVCLGRGGCIMGGLIAGNLGTVRICTMDRLKVTSRDECMSVPDFFVAFDISAIATKLAPNRKLHVLLVTGEIVTGFDLYYARQRLEKDLGSAVVDFELRTVAFSCLATANVVPDMCYRGRQRVYKLAPWRMTNLYVNDRREDGLFHIEKQR